MARAADVERPGAQRWVPPDPDVSALRSAVHDCRGCELWQPATQAVFSEGPDRARLVLVGEQPGDQEDRRGEPFVGPAGAVLDEALGAAGVAPDDVYVTNTVKHFRFEERGKRRLHKKPGVAHVTACRPWLLAELAVVRPRVVVCLGATAARGVLGHDVKVTEVRGTLLTGADAGDAADAVLVTSHPSAVLRLRGTPDYAEAFDALVTDLRTAAAAAAA